MKQPLIRLLNGELALQFPMGKVYLQLLYYLVYVATLDVHAAMIKFNEIVSPLTKHGPHLHRARTIVRSRSHILTQHWPNLHSICTIVCPRSRIPMFAPPPLPKISKIVRAWTHRIHRRGSRVARGAQWFCGSPVMNFLPVNYD